MSFPKTRLAACLAAAACVAAVPAAASAADTPLPKDGPVAFGAGIIASGVEFKEPQGSEVVVAAGKVGTLKDKRESLTVPEKDAKRFSAHASSYAKGNPELPTDAKVTPYSLTAGIAETNVPSAAVKGDFWLRPTDDKSTHGWGLYLNGVATGADCPAPDKVAGTATAASILAKVEDTQNAQNKDGVEKKIDVPKDSKPVVVKDVKLGKPTHLDAAATKWATDVKITRVTELAALSPESVKAKAKAAQKLAEDGAEDKASGTVAGWFVEVEDFAVKPDGTRGESLGTTDFQFGLVACGVPKDFVAKPVPSTTAPGGAPSTSSQPAVPVKIPAGDDPAQAAAAEGSSPAAAIGIGAVLLAGAGAGTVLYRRRVRS
ncbi:hypothetical protein [Amycolatopsis sp. CA-230715]|uniref:hypothetical protein n=1 Tax=Amycolatopsis sp. CA-230715 TaxID=2745196 RepID=UPI001C01276B|nr:hypothetical protein [Amycolatopsis sp. CA-230715]QWF77303.1 hypothetical protein HUW46_00695 [Amycolatopsis sp. CA-230715]